MNQTTSAVTRKGQVTIPANLRKKFNIGLNSRVRVSEGQNYVKIEHLNDVESLAGSLQDPRQIALSINDLRKIREKSLIFSNK